MNSTDRSIHFPIPTRFNIAEAVIDRRVAAGDASKTAAWWGDRALTYGELRELINRFGNALRALGVVRGDRVMLRTGTNLDAMIAILGTMKIGAVAIPTNFMLREHELEKILRNSEAKVAVTMAELAEPLHSLRSLFPDLRLVTIGGSGEMSWERLIDRASANLNAEPTFASDPAFIVYTSGTTGEPKGVEHAHRWLLGAGDPVNRVMTAITARDVCYQPQDWSFVYPLGSGCLYSLYAGATIVIPEGRFDPELVLKTIERRGVTIFSAVPTIYRMMIAAMEKSPKRASSLRMGVSAGEALPTDTFAEWRDRFGVTIHDGLGQSECHIFIGNCYGARIKPGSMGKPIPSYEIAILDDNGRPQSTGTPGHLVIRNDHPGLALGYRRDSERWAEVNRGGWYYTKDVAYVDDDGYYWYVSRSDDLIKSRAYLISPREVESALLEHPAILEAAVVGISEDGGTQRVKAFVTLKPGRDGSDALAQEIRAHVRATIAPYKVPQEIAFVRELPKTATGKILRRELRGRN